MNESQITPEQCQRLEKNLKSRPWRLNNLYQGVNDEGQEFKFVMNWAQTALFRAMWFMNIVLKARQLGFTTFICIFILDMCLWNKNIRAGIIAHTREDAEDIFQHKIKYVYDQLPDEIKLMVSATQSSVRKLTLSNGSSIRVGTSLRSGTYQVILISEHGKICAKYPEKAREIRTGTLNTVHPGQMLFIESTAEGRDGDFFKFCKDSQDMERTGRELSKLDFKFHFFPWWKHPGNKINPTNVLVLPELSAYFSELAQKHNIQTEEAQRAWYAVKYKTQQDDMKREHPSTAEEAFEAAVIGAFYAVQMALARSQRRIGKVPHNPGILVNTAWDLGIGESDSMSIWFYQMDGQVVNLINYYENSDEWIPHYIDVLKGDHPGHEEKKAYRYKDHYAPHDIKKRDPILGAGKDRLQAAADLGMNFTRIPRTPDLIEDINLVRSFLYRCYFDEELCNRVYNKKQVGIGSLDAFRKEWDEKNSVFRTRPLHNYASHGDAAFRTLANAVIYDAPAETFVPTASYQPMDVGVGM
jgi:hypothetical protein